MFSGISIESIFILLGSLVLAVGFHEAMHAYVAYKLGDKLAYEEGRISLNPFRHIDVLTTVLLPFVLILFGQPPIFAAKPVPFNASEVRHGEYGIALVALAGPFTNLVLAALSALVIHVFGIAIGTPLYDVVSIFCRVNISLFVFNMIPFPPLDGSRLLYAFAPDPVRRIMEQIEAFGFLMLLFVIILLFPFISPVINGISTEIYTFLLR